MGELRLRLCTALALALGVAGGAFAQGNYGPVGGSETLWSVATKVNAGRSSTTAQMAWALYRANPQAFDGSPNKIRPGSSLKVPAPAFVAEVAAAQAYAYVTGSGAPPAAAVTAAPRPALPAPAPSPVPAPVAVAAAPAPAPSGIVTTALASTAFAGSAEQRTAASMVGQRRGADEVFRYLAPLEGKYAGDVDYDYLLGTTAHDAGQYSVAVFVLQRAVAMRPRFAGARMELARAYYAQGDNESARREFAILEKDNPPPEARRVIAEYMDAIDRRAAAYQSQLAGYAELATGYDTNANAAPDIQDFLGFQLDSRNQSAASSYYNLGFGGLVSYPFAPGWRLFGTGNLGYRSNPDASFVDSQVLRLGGAVEWRRNVWELSLAPLFAMSMLDGEDNNQVVAVDLAGTRHFQQARVSLNVRSSQTRYADGLEVLDVDTLAYGIAGLYATRSMPRMQYVAAITLGSDDAVEPASAYGRDISGLRAGAITDFGGGHVLFVGVGTLSADYDGTFFGADRSDDQLSGTLGYEWGGWRTQGWIVRGQLNYVDNSSSVALYDYDRIDLGLSVRREFR